MTEQEMLEYARKYNGPIRLENYEDDTYSPAGSWQGFYVED